MPHGETWFSFLPFHARLLQLARVFSKPFNDEGVTWYAHQEPGVQHIYAALLVLSALVTVMKPAAPTLALGLKNLGVLVKLKASMRNSRLYRSDMLVRLKAAKSKLLIP